MNGCQVAIEKLVAVQYQYTLGDVSGELIWCWGIVGLNIKDCFSGAKTRANLLPTHHPSRFDDLCCVNAEGCRRELLWKELQ